MGIRTTYTVNRDEAIAIINDKRQQNRKKPKDYSHKNNEWLGDKLDVVVKNMFYNFIVTDIRNEEISTAYKINRHSVPPENE